MRNVLTVFLASPSDLSDERKRVSHVVAEVNESIKKWDWSIDLLGWEDTRPGYGRLQARINRESSDAIFLSVFSGESGEPRPRGTCDFRRDSKRSSRLQGTAVNITPRQKSGCSSKRSSPRKPLTQANNCKT